MAAFNFRTIGSVLGVALGVLAGTANAQIDYPNKPIRILVTFGPGGSTDVLARGLAKHLTQAWNQPVVVENKPGGGGSIGVREVAKAPADGYTLLAHSDSYAIAPAIYSNLPYDVSRDFAPVALLARAPNVVVVPANSPYKTLQELIDAGAVANKLSYATPGVGSATHMQAAIFASMAHIVDPVHVPYKSTPMAVSEVVNGRGDFIFAPLFNALPLIEAGKLRALAISTAERSPLLKDVPTVAEAGVPGYAQLQWWGLFAPSDVPADVMKKLETETQAALKTPEMLQLIESMSSTPGDLVGQDFADLVNASLQANETAAKANNIAVN
ncbi:MAG: tripartite tricarboxylate transporter substrate binding protein [Pusillimonas sp.]